MSDLAISSMLSFDVFRILEYAGAGVLAAVGTQIGRAHV